MRVFSRAGLVAAVVGWIVGIGPTAAAQMAALPPLPPPSETPAPSSTLPSLPAPSEAAFAEPAPPQPASPGHPDVDGAPANETQGPPREPDPWATRPFMIEGHLGAGTPVGILGAALDYSPWPVLGVNLGIGLGVSGPEYAFTSRVRLLRLGRRTHVALYLGAGVSAGAYSQPTDIDSFSVDGSQTESASERAHFHWDVAYWTNFEAGVEIRLRSGTSLRPYLGVSRLLNPDPTVTVNDVYSGSPPANPVVPWSGYVGFALGYSMAGW